MAHLASLKNALLIAFTAVICISCSSVDTYTETFSLQDLPGSFNSPASFTINADNDILFSSPNLHTDTLLEKGIITNKPMPTIGLIDQDDRVSTWYTFKPEDLEPTSGVVTPMGIAIGPDGNLYVADMQLWFGGISRVLRINVENGKAKDVDVVLEGISFPNAIAWHNGKLYISDTVLSAEKGSPTISGVYRVSFDELNSEEPLKISSYVNEQNKDEHLIVTFESNGSLGFGANGLSLDDKGNLYTGIMEDGTIFKTAFDSKGQVVDTILFASGLIASDGIQYDRKTNALYTTDLFDNALYKVDMDGKATLLTRNGNTDGRNNLLDGPGEAIVRGDKIYITNFDAAFGAPNMVNTTPDYPMTISVVDK